jgi:hypothetical protein
VTILDSHHQWTYPRVKAPPIHWVLLGLLLTASLASCVYLGFQGWHHFHPDPPTYTQVGSVTAKE